MASGFEVAPVAAALRLPRRLSPDEFARVDRLLVGSLKTLGAWRWSWGYVTRGQVARVLRLVSAADDPEQAYVRRCGAELALIGAGIPVSTPRPLRVRGRSLTSVQFDAVHAFPGSPDRGARERWRELARQDRQSSPPGPSRIFEDADAW